MKRSLPTEGDDDSNTPHPGRHGSGSAPSKTDPPPPKFRRKGKGIMSALRTLTASGSGSDGSTSINREGCLPTPPTSPAKSSRHKTSFSQRISRVNTLFRGPFDGSSSHKHKPRETPSIKSQQSVETTDTIETGSVLSPASSKTATTASSSNSNGISVKSPISTGKTSVDSRFTSASAQERDHHGSAEKKQLNSGTVITRQHPGAHMLSSPDGNLTPIEETALDYANVTILTVERAAAAKIYLETYFNDLLSHSPTPRDIRRRKLEAELHRRMHDENFTPEEQEQMRADYCRRETEHLRENRVMKSRSIRALTAERGDPGGRLDDEYEVLKILGKGSFGVVRLVKEKSGGELHADGTPDPPQRQVYAMKVIRKSDMLRTSQEGHLRAERDFLVASEGSDWIVPLVASFQDAANLYLVMEYMPGGDFLGLLIRENILHETVARFYIAEMIVCIEAAHALKCIHRDVKPDNFLISASGHLKISDFGLAFDGHWSHDMGYYNSHRYSLIHKLGIAVEGDEQDKEEARSVQATLKWTSSIMTGIEKHDKKHPDDGEPLLNWRNRCGNRTSAMSVVGTSQYMAPEVVAGKPYDARYEGRQMTKHNILRHHETLGFPARPPVSHRCRQLMEALIRDKEDRLSSKRYKFKDLTSASPAFANIATASSSRSGATAGNSGPKDFRGRYVFPNDAEDIKAHKWFRGIPWDRLHQLEPPFVPRIRAVDDTHYFDEEEEISDWSDSHTTEGPDDATPTIPQSLHRHNPVVANSNPLAATAVPSSPLPMDPHFLNLTLTPTTTSAALPVIPPHAPTIRQAREEEARLFLRGLRRSIQKWALAAIALPYDSTRVQSQLDALPGLDAAERARLRHFVRLFGRKDRKRPRDRLLRDRATKGVVMDVRKRTAFLGYTWRRMRPVGQQRGVLPGWHNGMGSGGARGEGEGSGMGMGMGGTAHGGGGDGMFEREGLRYGFPGFGYVGGVAAGGFGDEYDFDYGSGWTGAGARAGAGPHWENVSAFRALHGKGRFSWR